MMRRMYGKQFIDGRATHITSALTQPPLASHCDTLAAKGGSKKYNQLRPGCEKIDERTTHLSDQIQEVGKRTNDAWTNLITTAVAFVVIAATGILDETPASKLMASLSPIALNLLLSFRALVSAKMSGRTLTEKEKILTEEYKQLRWQLDRLDAAMEHHDQDEENPRGSQGRQSMSMSSHAGIQAGSESAALDESAKECGIR